LRPGTLFEKRRSKTRQRRLAGVDDGQDIDKTAHFENLETPACMSHKTRAPAAADVCLATSNTTRKARAGDVIHAAKVLSSIVLDNSELQTRLLVYVTLWTCMYRPGGTVVVA
jgi:hypothetical protein